ncbi:MAG: DUF2231 domain-containing protein [Haliscomenobacter sp.]|uniref:DUF2231 domain-containing protein n=1 Tax=Haliscomenobacter sp. TaxID=2717303 RepID=UPI0029A445AD|nr:DUF2231 domain-containing protein [Haliscomenobacter sp.]MDX2071708.1 DUF2231 domain-containing protein [Haliscomenobacter sp.]
MLNNFPSLHPLAVHFPIVLILLAVGFQTAVIWKPWNQIRWATMAIMGLAFISSLLASTIFHAELSADAPIAAVTIFSKHEKYAQYTLWASGLTFFFKVVGDYYRIYRKPYDLFVLTMSILTAVFLSLAGHFGANLVHIQGVGPQGKYLMAGHGAGMKMNNSEDKKKMPQAHDMQDMSPSKETPANHDMQKMNQPGSKPLVHDMQNISPSKEMPASHDMQKMNQPGSKPVVHDMQDMSPSKEMPANHDMQKMNQPGSKPVVHDMQDMSPSKEMPANHDMQKMNQSSDMSKKMRSLNAMDTIRFSDNNPARRKSKLSGAN